jgi:hypothetical protein
MTLEFNPNEPAKTKQFFWATYIPSRRPNFKLHSNRGHALNAFANHFWGAILYKWENDEWVEIYREEKDDAKTSRYCENCGKDLKRPDYGSYWGTKMWIDKKTDKPRRIMACYECERLLR